MLIDAHIHCALSGSGALPKNLMASDSEARQKWFETLAALYAKNGIRAVRDGGDRYGVGPLFKQVAEAAGVIVKTPIKALYKKGCYGSFLGEGLTGLTDCRRVMTELIAQKPDHIKIIQSGMMSLETYGEADGLEFTREELGYLIKRAHDAGLSVMVHVNTPEGIRMALEEGADTIEHAYGIGDEELEQMRENKVIWVPTLVPFANISVCPDDHFMAGSRVMATRYYEGHKQQVKKAASLGVKIALGSDSGATLVEHGKASLQELESLKACGLTETVLFQNACEALGLSPESLTDGREN